MTVCIAAIATEDNGDKYIVTASDRMLAMQELSADAIATKSHHIANEWGLMWSAEDASYVTPIYETTRAVLFPKRQHVHLDEVARAVAGAYQRQIQEEAGAKYLSRYGLSMSEFLKRGRDLFPPAQYEEMHREIRAVRLGCDFLGLGFDDGPHLFRVCDPGKVIYEDEVGFTAIGSGWYSAISTLFFHGVNDIKDLWEVVYHVLEAKFMAESAPGVGEDTWAEILDENGNATWLMDFFVKGVREMWQRSGMPRVPRSAKDNILEGIKECRKECARMDRRFEKEIEQRHKKLEAKRLAIESAKTAVAADGKEVDSQSAGGEVEPK